MSRLLVFLVVLAVSLVPGAAGAGELVSLGWDAGTAEQLMRVREPLVPSHTSVDNLMRALLRVMSLRHD